MTVTDGIPDVSRNSTVASLFEFSKGFVVVDSDTAIEVGSVWVSSEGENAPSLRCTRIVVDSSDEGLGWMSLLAIKRHITTHTSLFPAWSQYPIHHYKDPLYMN